MDARCCRASWTNDDVKPRIDNQYYATSIDFEDAKETRRESKAFLWFGLVVLIEWRRLDGIVALFFSTTTKARRTRRKHEENQKRFCGLIWFGGVDGVAAA